MPACGTSIIGIVGGVVAPWLVCLSLAGAACCVLMTDTLISVFPSTQVYKLVSVKSMMGVTLGWTCSSYSQLLYVGLKLG